MDRDTLQSALSQDVSASARATLAQLEAGADFEVFLNQTASAQQLWDIWSWRHEVMLETGVTPRPGLVEAIAGLQAAGTARVYMATVTGTRRRFTIFLSEDLTQCVACW
jgi:beta-phosphoglucomutase-like phosphatase (HAD superfamily)